MFPEPKAMALRIPQSANAQNGKPATTRHSAHAGAGGGEAATPNQIRAALQMRAALRAAHVDATNALLAKGQWHEWTWKVKAYPRPPLVFDSTQDLNSKDLLANDSLGG